MRAIEKTGRNFLLKLDSDLLRTFLAVIETGSISAGAIQIGRSQSATSLQVKRLEVVLGKPLFERHSRGIVLTRAGEKLEITARQAVSLLDNSLADITSSDVAGRIRMGIPDDQSKAMLSDIVAKFAKDHPRVELDVRCASGAGFSKEVATGELDLALYEVKTKEPGVYVLREEQTFWATSRFHNAHMLEPLPVALFDRACWWCDVALETLKASGRNYRVVFTSESVAGVTAAVEAGIAVALLGERSIGGNSRVLTEFEHFRHMPVSKLVLETGTRAESPALSAMSSTVRKAFADVVRR